MASTNKFKAIIDVGLELNKALFSSSKKEMIKWHDQMLKENLAHNKKMLDESKKQYKVAKDEEIKIFKSSNTKKLLGAREYNKQLQEIHAKYRDYVKGVTETVDKFDRRVRKEHNLAVRKELAGSGRDYKKFIDRKKKELSSFFDFSKKGSARETKTKIDGINKEGKAFTKGENSKETKAKATHKNWITRWKDRIKKLRIEVKEGEKKDSALDGFKKGITGSMNSITGGIGQKLGTIAGYGLAAAPMAAVLGLAKAMKYAVTVAVKYEKMFADIQARGGFAAKELQNVKTAIFEVAGATKFSVEEIGASVVSLAKLGFTAGEVVNILPTVGAVAAAAGESLEETGEALGKTINIFQRASDDASIIGDEMTKAFTSSALNLKYYSNAMSYAGAAATATMTSTTQLTSAMEVLADNGITASKAGTGLRNIFMQLGDEGNDLNDIIEDLIAGNMSYAESVELVGKRAANQLYILTQNYDDVLKKQEELSNSTGESLRRAAVQMNTVDAQWTAMMNEMDATVAEEGANTLGWLGRMIRQVRMLKDSGIRNVSRDFVILNRAIAQNIKEKYKEAEANDNLYFFRSKLSEQEKEAIESVGLDAGALGAKSIINELDKLNIEENAANKKKEVLERVRGIEKKMVNDIKRALLDSGKSGVNEVIKGFQEKYALTDEDYMEINPFYKIIKGDSVTDAMISEGMEKITKKAFDQMDNGDLVKDTEEEIASLTDHLENFNKVFKRGKGNRYEVQEGVARDLEVSKSSFKAMLSRVEDVNKLMDELCAAGELQYCKGKDKSGRTEFGTVPVFVKDPIEENRYNELKANLDKRFKLMEDEPEVQAQIQKKLIENNRIHFASLVSQRKAYGRELVKYQGGIDTSLDGGQSVYDSVNNYIKRNNSTQTQLSGDNVVADETVNKKNRSVFIPNYEPALTAQEEFAKKMVGFENEVNEAKSEFTKFKIYEKMKEAAKEYYQAELDNLELARSILEVNIESANITNAQNPDTVPIDTKAAEKALISFDKKISKMKTDAKGANEKLDDKSECNTIECRTKEIQEYLNQAITTASDVYNIWADARERDLDELKDQVARELEIVQDKYDAEVEMQSEALKAGNINQEEYEEARRRAEKKRIAAENKENERLFNAQKENDLINAKASFIQQLATSAMGIWAAWGANPVAAAIMTGISATAMSIQSANQISAINSRKFTPQKFAEGGMVYGRSHEEGGIPFSVKGQSGYEMEGGEFLVKKSKVAANIDKLRAINGDSKPNTTFFRDGGVVNSELSGGTDYTDTLNKMIEVLDKPVRAYVSNQDVADSITERNALTHKTNF